MPSIRISKRTVDAARVPSGNDVYYWDEDLKGFGLRVTPKGARSYVFQYRMPGKPAQRLTIGKHGTLTPDGARQIAKMHAHRVASGINPIDEAKRKERDARVLSFSSYVDRFEEECLKEEWPDSWAEAKAILSNHVSPKLKDRALPEIEAADIRDVIDPIRSKKALARKVWAVLSRVFTWAIEQGDLSPHQNPMAGMKPPPKPKDRKRVLSPDELVAVWKASFALNDPWGPYVRVLMATLQRRAEVAGLPWKELDQDRALWLMDGDRAKNDQDHLVPLNALAMAELNGMGWKRRGLVFTTTGSTPVSGYSKMKKALDKAMLPVLQELADKRAAELGEDPHPVELEPWRLHDLRRSGTTALQALGFPIEVTEKVINHKSGEASGIAKVYNLWAYEPEKRAALNAWGEYLDRLVKGAGALNVVTLPARAA